MVVQHNITGNERQQNVKRYNRTAGKIHREVIFRLSESTVQQMTQQD